MTYYLIQCPCGAEFPVGHHESEHRCHKCGAAHQGPWSDPSIRWSPLEDPGRPRLRGELVLVDDRDSSVSIDLNISGASAE